MLSTLVLAAGLLVGLADEPAEWKPALPAQREVVTVTVTDGAGMPVAAVDVQLHVALSCDRLLPGEEAWRSLERIDRQTRKEGVATFKDVPKGATLTAFCHGQGGFGVASGTGDLAVTLEPTGTVSGSVNIKDAKLRRLHNLQLRHESGWTLQTERMDTKGRYTFYDVPPGEISVSVRRGSWTCETRTGKVKSGRTTKIKAFRPKDGRYDIEGADPCLDVPKVELVDEDGQPLEGLSFWWSSPTGFGVGLSDAKGVVDMQSRGLWVGDPPFVLHLGLIGRPEGDKVDEGIEDPEAVHYVGAVKTVRRSGAVVEVRERLRQVTGRLLVDGEAAELYRLRAIVGGDDAPRGWGGSVSPGPDDHNPIQRRKDEEAGMRPRGVYSLWVPPGDVNLRVVTLDGVPHDVPLTVPEGRGEFRHEIVLP